jgi:integrase
LSLCLPDVCQADVLLATRNEGEVMNKPIKLTVHGIAKAICPPDKSQKLWPIDGHAGTYLRTRRGSTAKPVLVQYRDASDTQRWYKVCDGTAVSPEDIGKAIAIARGKLAQGGDPAGERKAKEKRERARLAPALDAYERDLERRHVVKRCEVMSLLRRELLKPLGNVELGMLTRNELVERIIAVEVSGRPGAAQDLRTKSGVFLGWCADRGLITANPLAGWRRQRKTKAQRLDRPGRALEDWELPILWRAAEDEGWPFGPYLKMLLLLGQRRTETALMSWRDVDLAASEWCIPAEVTKSGRLHRVPLPPQAVAILKVLPRMARSSFVFPGQRGQAMTGWSKRLPPIYRATAKAGMPPWVPHDLRRTARTGLGKLGVDRVIAELLLNHAISDELIEIYDRGEYRQKRVEAAARWADHVMGVIDGGDRVVSLRAAALSSKPGRG